MEITKEGAQSLRMKIRNAWVVFERTHCYLRFLPAYSLIAGTNVKVEKTRLPSLVQLRAQEQVFNWFTYSSGGRWCRIVEVQLVEMTAAVATKRLLKFIWRPIYHHIFFCMQNVSETFYLHFTSFCKMPMEISIDIFLSIEDINDILLLFSKTLVENFINILHLFPKCRWKFPSKFCFYQYIRRNLQGFQSKIWVNYFTKNEQFLLNALLRVKI